MSGPRLRDPRYAPVPKEESSGPEDDSVLLPAEISGPPIDDQVDATRVATAGLTDGAVMSVRYSVPLVDYLQNLGSPHLRAQFRLARRIGCLQLEHAL